MSDQTKLTFDNFFVPGFLDFCRDDLKILKQDIIDNLRRDNRGRDLTGSKNFELPFPLEIADHSKQDLEIDGKIWKYEGKQCGIVMSFQAMEKAAELFKVAGYTIETPELLIVSVRDYGTRDRNTWRIGSPAPGGTYKGSIFVAVIKFTNVEQLRDPDLFAKLKCEFEKQKTVAKFSGKTGGREAGAA